MDIDTSGGAPERVQSRVLYAFWAFIFGVAFLVLIAGLVVVANVYRAGVVPSVGGMVGNIDATQAMLAGGAIAYTAYKVGMVFLVATFGRSDVESGTELAEESAEDVQDKGADGGE